MEDIKLNKACVEHHKDIIEKGFTDAQVGTKLMLVVSELTEALEADRKNHRALQCVTDYLDEPMDDAKFKEEFELGVKDTFEDEIADAFLRLMDICGDWRINIESHIQWKRRYNKLREYKHGKRY